MFVLETMAHHSKRRFIDEGKTPELPITTSVSDIKVAVISVGVGLDSDPVTKTPLTGVSPKYIGAMQFSYYVTK